MNFLPFVLSFLLILVLASSALFHSFRSTTIEKKIILAQNKARLGLINLEEKRKIAKLRKKDKKKEAALPETKKIKPKAATHSRDERRGYDASKLSLAILWTRSDPTLYRIVYESTIRLIELLYQEADFYRAAHDKDLARTLVHAMTQQKGESLLELFPEDPEVAKIYYKMLKGTNTGYPSLEEYFTLKGAHPPAQFRYASVPLLQALFGAKTTEQIIEKEKPGILTQEALRELLQQNPSPLLSVNDVGAVFSFSQERGEPYAFLDPETRIMAHR
jgi:hypothetical protein